MKTWVQKTGQPLSSLSPELYAVLRDLQAKEIDEDILKRISPLLEGRTVFSDEGDYDESEDE